MAPPSVTEEKQILQNLTDYRASTNRTEPYKKTLQQDIGCQRMTSGSGFAKFPSGAFDFVPQYPYGFVKPRVSTVTDLGSFFGQDQTPRILSPSPSVSTVVSPGNASGVWTSPRTPRRVLNYDCSRTILTPFTPPMPRTTRSRTEKHTFSLTTPLSTSPTRTIFDKIEACISRASKDQCKEKVEVQDGDDFVPGKLFRGLTAKIAASMFRVL